MSETQQMRELTADEIEAATGGVIAIIRPESARGDADIGGMDRLHSLLPYIEQR